MTNAAKKPACAERVYHITKADLPLSCPSNKMEIWDAHPKVYLPIEETGEEACPYCGAKYILDKSS